MLGVTCKHFKKYQTIYIEFPEERKLQLMSGSLHNKSLEKKIKASFAGIV